MIDTVGKKAVLILGRFTDERKAVLDALRNELRRCDYVPILFDFEKPESRTLTETVSILARLARFVIVDLTNPSSVPYELMHFLPFVSTVAVKPIIQVGNTPFSMYIDIPDSYRCVLPLHEYESKEQLIAELADKVILPAEEKVEQLRRQRGRKRASQKTWRGKQRGK